MIQFRKYIKLFIRNYPSLFSTQQFEDLFREAGPLARVSGGGTTKQIPSRPKNWDTERWGTIIAITIIDLHFSTQQLCLGRSSNMIKVTPSLLPITDTDSQTN